VILILKVDAPLRFKDFRPISLCNVILKLLSKVLVQCIRLFLNELIGPMQSSFILGRGMSNNAIVAQEVVHHV